MKDGKATGEMKMGGDPKPMAADLGGPLFADGPGAYQVVGALPLAEGYTTSFRNFDVQAQKGKIVQLSVAGSESRHGAGGHLRHVQGGTVVRTTGRRRRCGWPRTATSP